MRVVVLALALLAGLGGAAAPASESVTTVAGPVVVLGTAGLTWDDISDGTPALAALLQSGSVGVMVPKSIEATSCPVDGALAVSAGRRADARRGPPQGAASDDTTPGECLAPDVAVERPGGEGRVVGWADYLARAADQGFDARLGTLGRAVADAGLRSAALGPLAAVALAGPDGSVPRVWSGPADLPAALRTDPDLLVADLPRVSAPISDPAARQRQVAAVDAALVETLNALPDDATVLVASLADSPGTARLQLAAMVGPPQTDLGPGLLRSASTRQNGLVQVTDVLPSVLARLGVPVPDQVDGAPIAGVRTGRDSAARLELLLDLQDATAQLNRLRVPYYLITLGTVVVLLAGLGLVLRLRVRDRPGRAAPSRGVLRAIQVVALVGAGLPTAGVLAMLVPWWRSGAPGAALVVVSFGWALALAVVSLAGPWGRHPLGPPAVVAALTMAVLTADAAAGSPLTLVNLLGGDPLIGGRFYGFHNPVFALFGSATVVVGLGLATRLGRLRPAVVASALVGLALAAALVDVLPALGADVGGPPALLPAMALLALRAAGVRLTWARAALVGAATLALLTAVFVADWLRPPGERTHLGRFVQTLLDGGAWDVVRRKLVQNLEILTSTPLTMTVPLLAALAVWALARPERLRLSWVGLAYRRHRLVPDALLALGVLSALGFVANDSGTAIPPVVAQFTLPVLVAICSATVADEPTAPRRRPPPTPAAGPGSVVRRG